VAKASGLAFYSLAVAFVAAAAVHGAALIAPGVDPTSPPWRHALFVAINLGCALGFVARPRWFIAPFALLVVQQLVSHGGQAWRAWCQRGRLDVASLAVLAAMPFALGLLVADRRGRGGA
jgi:hypothetical protein